MMKCQFHWWRKPEHLEKTTDLRQVTDMYNILCFPQYVQHIVYNMYNILAIIAILDYISVIF